MLKKTSVKPAFYRLDTVLQLIPISRSTWLDGVKHNRFPQSVRLSSRTVAWRSRDIDDFIECLDGGNNE